MMPRKMEKRDMDQKIFFILIADDDQGDIKQLQRILKQTGLLHKCIAVNSVEEALTACESQPIDCIVVDYQFPGGPNGLEGIKILHHQSPHVPIIMLTGSGNEMVATEAMKRGASDYIIKENLTATLLKKSILNALEKAGLEKQLRDKESYIEYIAYHDYLTNLPNRPLFYHDLSKTLAQAKRHKKMFAVMLLDLDEFKNINDTFGHDVGDQLLTLVAVRLQSALRAEDTLARVGGDEFGILLNELENQDNAAFVAKNLILSLKKSFTINNKKMNMTASIGIAIYPCIADSVDDLLSKADKAMYVAKHHGRNNFQFYSL